MPSTIERQEDQTIELKITIPWSEIKKEWDIVVSDTVKNADLPGFRKGKAPKKLVEDKIDKVKVREEVLRKMLPKAYIEAVSEHKLKPIMDPSIHVEAELTEGEGWLFHAITCELPAVSLDGYKENVKKATAKSKIIVPGKEPEPAKLESIIEALLESVKVTVPGILIDREADRLLAQTLDEIKKLGMNLDQYLASTGRTAEALRQEYRQKAEKDIKLEFALQKVAENEKITVGEEEIETTIKNAKTPEEKTSLEANKYLLASIIKQQKTLDFLRSL